MLPVSTVESPGFKKLIVEMTSSSVQLPNRNLEAFLECQQQQMFGQDTVSLLY